MGLVNYYGKFLPNLASTLAPLLQKDKHWLWGEAQKKAFDEARKQLTSDKLLVHYDAPKELLLSCDASPYGIGAVLSHCNTRGQENPIVFASCSLSKSEQKYAHLDKEGLGIVFGVRRLHPYLFGRHFTIKPLQRIFFRNTSNSYLSFCTYSEMGSNLECLQLQNSVQARKRQL